MKPLALALLVVTAVTVIACRASSPTPGPEARCADACKAHASKCSEDECARGCRFLLDRLVEREGASILACVARVSSSSSARACDDLAFAECAASVGIHADGGPPAPPPKTDVDLVGEDDKKKDDD